MSNKNIVLTAVGVASHDDFVLELLPKLNNIINQPAVLSKYAQICTKTIDEIKEALSIPPQIRFSTVSSVNSFVDDEISTRRRLNLWMVLARQRQWWIRFNEEYFLNDVCSLKRQAKRNHQVYFIAIVLHELTHWLCFKLDALSPENPYPGEPTRESGENLELDLFGGRIERTSLMSSIVLVQI